MNKEFYRGEIFYIRNESEYSGNVQGGGRPAVIISNDIGNNAGPILEVVYLTTQEKKPLPTHVKINNRIWRQGACGLHDIRHKGHFPML